jgi:hypothetical protein
MNAERAFFTHVPSMLRFATRYAPALITALCSLLIDCGESIRSYHRGRIVLRVSTAGAHEQLVLRIASAKLGASWHSRHGQSGITPPLKLTIALPRYARAGACSLTPVVRQTRRWAGRSYW